ncbi:hypothetical protein GCM10009127_22810 [Alteraurantiacibacter aestuarii]|uniref:hypothetical protein n=1 Tax=Alteraurantiacibacter aestuarii TaxID=650004 RepID=UPI0031DF01E0
MAADHPPVSPPAKPSVEQPVPALPENLTQILSRAVGTGQEEVISFLCNPQVWPHAPASVEILETHMSLVFFAGDRVYKIKRAIQLKHMDMRSLAARQHFCRREVELNRLLAADVYLGCASVTRAPDGTLAIDGEGEAIEPLVVMRRLDTSQGLDQRILQDRVSAAEIDRLCALLSNFYARQPPADISGEEFLAIWHEIVGRVRTSLTDPRFALEKHLVDPPITLLTHFLETHEQMLLDLVDHGRIVDGHGDLKPEHIVMGDKLLVIDRLEFDDRLRMADPFAEITFLGLECERLGAPWIGPRLIDGLAQRLGRRPPDELLRFYRCYQACLRARLSIEHRLDPSPRTPDRWPRQTRDYLMRALPSAQP